MVYFTVLCYMTASYSYNTIVITSLIMLTCIISYYIVKSNITVGYNALKYFVVYCYIWQHDALLHQIILRHYVVSCEHT